MAVRIGLLDREVESLIAMTHYYLWFFGIREGDPRYSHLHALYTALLAVRRGDGVDAAVLDVVPDPLAPDREALGAQVRAVWIDWAREQPAPKESWFVPYAQLAEADKEVDRRIGERLYLLGRMTAQREDQSA